MRILYISEGNIPSKFAHTVQAMKMAEALASQADSLTMVTAGGWLRSADDEIDLHEWYGVSQSLQIARLPVYGRTPGLMGEGNQRRYTRPAALYARICSPDLVYTRSKQVARYCARLGLRTILETHSGVDEFSRRLRGAASHRNLIGIVTVTDHLKREYVAGGAPEFKIFVWPDAVDLDRFANPLSQRAARAELGLPADGTILTYCGHFYEAKGVSCLVEAAKLLPDVLFCLVGGWPDDIQRIQRLAANANNVRLCGFVANQQVPRFLAAADILALPNSNKFEHAKMTSPLKLFEYMATRRPILATRIPALEGLLRHGRNAYVVTPDSPPELAHGIRELMADPSTAQRMADNAANDVARYTWKSRAAEILSHFARYAGVAA